MRASVIIPACNAVATLPLTLEALTRQEIRADFEVIVVDDASTDGTGRTARAHAGGLNLRLLRTEENLGRARARHWGIQQSLGEIVLLLDADIEVIPEYMKIHLALHETRPRAVGIGAMQFPPPLAGKALAAYTVTRGAAKLPPGALLPGKYFISCLASFPRTLYEETGGFDPTFRNWGGEDLELGLRFQKLGAELVNLPAAIGYHHHLRSLGEMLGILEQYGREAIPRILELHPEFAVELFVDDLLPTPRAKRATALWRRLAASGVFFHPLARLAEIFSDRKLPRALMNYLTWAAYRQGFGASRAGK